MSRGVDQREQREDPWAIRLGGEENGGEEDEPGRRPSERKGRSASNSAGRGG